MNLKRLSAKVRYYLFDLVSPRTITPADVDVDIVIPVTTKDLATLPLSIEGVRRNVVHNIAAIYIVARRDDAIIEFCRQQGLTFVDETTVLGYGPGDIGLMAGVPPRNRSGWLFQQLLKLSGEIGRSPFFITIDADHVLLRPHTFVSADGRLVFYRSKEYHAPYFENIKRLLDIKMSPKLSYVAHKMVFDRELLTRMRGDIEQTNVGRSWDAAIIESVDRSQLSGFSEFETFGNYVASSRQHSLPFRNHHLMRADAKDYDELQSRYAGRYAAVTFPDYLA